MLICLADSLNVGESHRYLINESISLRFQRSYWHARYDVCTLNDHAMSLKWHNVISLFGATPGLQLSVISHDSTD